MWSVQVSGAGEHLDGVYDMDQGGYNNGQPVYKRIDEPLMYLYSWTGNSNQHFSPIINDGFTYIWAVSGTCPTDKLWLDSGESGWEVNPDIQVECIDCVDITTNPPPTTITFPDGSIPCVPGRVYAIRVITFLFKLTKAPNKAYLSSYQ